MTRLLVIDLDKKHKSFYKKNLAAHYQLTFIDNDNDIYSKIQSSHFDLALLSIEDNNKEDFDLLSWLKLTYPHTPVIVTNSSKKAESVVKSIKMGADDYIIKPPSSAKLLYAFEKALEHRSLKNEIDYLRHEQDVIYNFDNIIAYCARMKQVVQNLKKFSKTDSTILMTGETGTGKSMLSGTVHFNSHRRNKPFVKINCANIQETLLESELFGHNKGAFTGADKMRIGRFEQANGGTIFLDEIGEMSMTLQAKLLRVLEEKSFERVGGNQTIHSDVRVIAATNQNLEEKIQSGNFREDLFYRINVLPIKLPPLRERSTCLEPLAHFLLQKISRTLRKNFSGFEPVVIKLIKKYTWPGNIRQLANTIERAMILSEGETIELQHFSTGDIASNNSPKSPSMALHDNEKDQIISALHKNLWIQKDAAKVLGISPRVLNHKIKKYGITHSRWRKNI